MFELVFRASFALVGAWLGFCQVWFPTNYLVRWIYTDRGLKWGVPVAVVLVPVYYWLGHFFEVRIAVGGSEWWWLAFAWALINCFKFLSVGVRTPFVWVYRVVRRRLAPRLARHAGA